MKAYIQRYILTGLVLVSLILCEKCLLFAQVSDPNNISKNEQIRKLDGQLTSVFRIWEKKHEVAAKVALTKSGAQIDQDGRVKVVLMPEPGKKSESIEQTNFQRLNISVFAQSQHLVEVYVPIDALQNLTHVKGVFFVRLPFVPSLDDVITEGATRVQAPTFTLKGYTGQGVKVGIIDVGFAGVPNLQVLGELPNVITRNFTDQDIYSGVEFHGSACAEIIHDIAPDAELYLYKAWGLTAWEKAKDAALLDGVDIISFSLGNRSYGVGDGTGLACKMVDDAFQNNVLWVKSAGNYAKKTISQIFRDTDGDGLHNFEDGSNVIWLQSTRSGTEIWGNLAWDDGEATNNNYDIFLMKRQADGGHSIVIQTEKIQYQEPPYETLRYNIVETATYGFAIGKDSGARDLLFKFHSINHNIEGLQSSPNSISTPGDAYGSLTVGAMDQSRWTIGPVEDFSSRGPTADGRIKPDLIGPDKVTTISYAPGNFPGTSAAAPHVAGAAALLKSSNPIYYTAQNLYDALTRSVVDMGVPGKDNEFGAGRLDLSLLPTGSPKLSLSLQELNFGSLVTGTEQALDLGFVNSGNATLVVDGIFTSPGDYQIVPSTFLVPPGRSTQITITFQPQRLGDRSGTATIISNLPDLPRIEIPINAQSVVQPPIPEPKISISNALVAFGSITLGEASTTTRIVMNFGDAPLTIHSITSPDNQVSIFPNQLTISAKASRNISIRYQPIKSGSLSSQITVNSTDPNSPTISIPVSGSGLQVQNQTFSMLASVVGQSQNAQYEIADDGLVEIQIQGQQVGGAIGFRSLFTYDPAVMAYEGFEIGSGIPNSHSPGPYFPNGEGTVEVMAGAFGSQVSQTDASLGTVRFRAKDAFDTGSITMQQVRIRRSGAFEVFDSDVVLNFIKKATSGIPADFDKDGSVGFSDFLVFAASFSSRRGDASFVEAHDLDHSGDIGFSDFIIFARDFGKS